MEAASRQRIAGTVVPSLRPLAAPAVSGSLPAPPAARRPCPGCGRFLGSAFPRISRIGDTEERGAPGSGPKRDKPQAGGHAGKAGRPTRKRRGGEAGRERRYS
jgi:hypothetical protein